MPNNLKNSHKSELLCSNYRRWKLDSLDEAGYFVIFQGFLESDLLNKISGNALKLYVYLGINSNNFEGIVWHSNYKIAQYFNKSERTIRTWMKELEDFELITRMQLKYDGNAYTYLLPYKSKYEETSRELAQGTITVTKENNLIVECDNQIRNISSGISLYIFDEYINEWVEGKIIINRPIEVAEYFNNITYVFKPKNEYVNRNIYMLQGRIYKVKIKI